MGEARERKRINHRRLNVPHGFTLCKKCNGYGYTYILDNEILQTYQGKALATKCLKCNGSGFISWLEEIFSKG
jgi:DnaJ-class molecular chaperone